MHTRFVAILIIPCVRYSEVVIVEVVEVRAKLGSICASEGVIISAPGVTGANTVIWREE